MGLSTKEAASDGLTWSKVLMQAQNLELPKPPAMRRQLPQTQQQHPPEKCPRCESMNTKFCYYNNYNKSQPRFFCKACKRHWTKGGTLRNVPVGGGRKNKRLKTSNTSSSTAANVTATTKNTSSLSSSSINNVTETNNITTQAQQQFYKPPLYQPFFPSAPSQLQENFNSKNFCSPNGGIFLGSTSNPLFSYPSSSGQHDSIFSTISTSAQASKGSVFAAEESRFMEGLHVSTSIPTTTTSITQPWQVPSMSSTSMDARSCWTWDDIDKLVSSDITTTWDDNEIKH